VLEEDALEAAAVDIEDVHTLASREAEATIEPVGEKATLLMSSL
jgi:hypothetical protein